jgi:DNA-binding winged helix-turn-helix (wHTH) protein/tetratricopeptide (TPR) repeat protein
VTFGFGPFRLDEPGRVLWLAEREMPLQPRVFDLLALLIRHRERVVSKDELLDALWPDVTVTENSLQRAVSTLRGVLREGGMDGALRNFPGKGYRFLVDGEAPQAMPPAADAESGGLEGARRAITEQRWRDADAVYARCAGETLTGKDLAQWALALQCLGKQQEAVPVLVRAVAAYADEGDNDSAAECAVAISTLHFERNEGALGKGWLARAEDLTSEMADSRAIGRVYWMQSRILASDGDMQRALELTEAAYNCGLRRGDAGTEALGLMYRGFYRLGLGDTRGGLADQDHASAFALSQNIDPVTGSTLYCNILWACRTFGDWARANQWTLGYQRFCDGGGMEFSGPCQLHRAEVLGVQGSLHDALAHVNDALGRLSDDAPWSVGDAHRVLGDIHSAIGNTELALAAYEKSYALGWDPEPGYAMLQLELGQGESAYAGLERSLLGQSWWTLQRQGILLAHLALVAARTGRTEKARSLVDDLAGQDERWPMPSIRALTNEASALIVRNQGDAGTALRHLQLARQLWTSIDSRLNAARLRVQIAAMQLDLGDFSGAAVEIRAALAASAELQSRKLDGQCRQLQARLQ